MAGMDFKALAARVAELKKQAQPSSLDVKSSQRVFFLGSPEDQGYLFALKQCLKGWTCDFSLAAYAGNSGFTSFMMFLKNKGYSKVISTRSDLLADLVNLEGNLGDITPSINNYAGSLFTRSGMEVLFVDPLPQMRSKSYGRFLTERFISKFTEESKWDNPTKFNWSLVQTERELVEFLDLADRSILASTDIETKRHNLAIDCFSYTFYYILQDGLKKTVESKTLVIELKDEWSYEAMRRLGNTKVSKILQNGKYDNAYYLRFNCPIRNWFWDTAHFFHAWLSEMPKDLGFLNAFFLRNVIYWKDLSESGDRQDYLRYNALDSWATGNIMMQMLLEAPAWAKKNYFLKFPKVFPSLLSEMTGIPRDQEKLKHERAIALEAEEKALTVLRTMVGNSEFKPTSHVHVKKLMCIMGAPELSDSSDEKTLKRFAFKHPLNALVVEQILKVRGLSKLQGTYLRTDEDGKFKKDGSLEGGSKDYKGTILYSLNPHGTDTGRNSSKESAFWCGFNIQNIPSGPSAPKRTIISPPGFLFAEADLEQAESRDTAYISGDSNLIEAVSDNDGDFHSYNASRFFGVPYEDIFDRATKKKLRKDLRDLGKPINHGANYNMGPEVLIDSMGLKKVFEAGKALKLPFTNPLAITESLLVTFHKTYPSLKGQTVIKNSDVANYFGLHGISYKFYAPGTYYAWVADSVRTSSKLVSRAYHHTAFNLSRFPDIQAYTQEGDWTRYCFGDPVNNKLSLNSYVAHCPSSLNARTLDEAFEEVFWKVALGNKDFRLYAQIHDSILHGFREGREDLSYRVKELMEIPITLTDISGVTRTFTVPAAIKAGKSGKGAKSWAETE